MAFQLRQKESAPALHHGASAPPWLGWTSESEILEKCDAGKKTLASGVREAGEPATGPGRTCVWRDEGKEEPVSHPSQAGGVAVQRPCGLVTGRREQEGQGKGSCREAFAVTLG